MSWLVAAALLAAAPAALGREYYYLNWRADTDIPGWTYRVVFNVGGSFGMNPYAFRWNVGGDNNGIVHAGTTSFGQYDSNSNVFAPGYSWSLSLFEAPPYVVPPKYLTWEVVSIEGPPGVTARIVPDL